jgi:hypothetical protein
VLDPRGQLLRAALGFAGLPRPSYDRALWALRTWLDSWSGIGHVVVGMARQGFDLQLTRYDERGWRATFYTTEIVGKESVTLKPGQSGSLPPRTVHDDKNASQTAPLKFLVFHVAKKGDPLAVPVQ